MDEGVIWVVLDEVQGDASQEAEDIEEEVSNDYQINDQCIFCIPCDIVAVAVRDTRKINLLQYYLL